MRLLFKPIRLPASVVIASTLLASWVTPVAAAEPYVGTWAPKGTTCTASNFHWVFEPDKAHNEAFACERAAYVHLDGERWVAHMSHCKSIDSRFATDEHFTLSGDVMVWRDKTLRRCASGIP